MDTRKLVNDLYISGKYESMSDIARELNIDRSTVLYHLRKLGLHKPAGGTRGKFVEISDNAEQVILGSILGDGTITKYIKTGDTKKWTNSKLEFTHCEKQKDYAIYKKSLLESNGLKCKDVRFRHKSTRVKSIIKGKVVNGTSQYQVYTKKTPSLNKYRDMFYGKQSVKFINRYIYKLNRLGLAIWFMDDGSLSGSHFVFYTDCFSDKDLFILRDMLLRNFNLHTKLYSNGGGRKCVICINREDNNLFVSLIKDFVCDCMQYKIKLSTKNSVNLGKS